MQNKIGKWNITSRLELLLAKIAGHDVDLSTMTPPVASNLTEELLLEIADKSGGGQLPVPTADDVGRTVVVKKTAKPGEVMIPEQTVVLDDSTYPEARVTPIDNIDDILDMCEQQAAMSIDHHGPEFIAVIDGEQYTGVIFGEDGLLSYDYIGEDTQVLFVYTDGFFAKATSSKLSGTEHTVAMYLADYEYEYGVENNAGNDISNRTLFIGGLGSGVNNLGVYEFQNIRTIDQQIVSAQEAYDAVLGGGTECCWDGYTFCSEGFVNYQSAFNDYIFLSKGYGKSWDAQTDSCDFRSLGVVRNRVYAPATSSNILSVTIEFVIAKVVFKGKTSYLPLYYVAESGLLYIGDNK